MYSGFADDGAIGYFAFCIAGLILFYMVWKGVMKPVFGFVSKYNEEVHFFTITWFGLLILNQLFLVDSCFSLYCILIALPHTGMFAGIITLISFSRRLARQKAFN